MQKKKDEDDEVRKAMKDYFEQVWAEAARAYAQANDLHYRERWIDQILEIKRKNADQLK